jgi:SSS family solute:Na+ symporter
LVFSWLLVLMLVIGELKPRETEFVQEDVGAVTMTPWKFARPAGIALIIIVISIYVCFADFSVLQPR